MPELIPNPPDKQPKYCKKTIMAMKMVAAGIEPREALKTVNCKDSISHQAITELKEKVRKHSLTSQTLVKPAHKLLKDILLMRAKEEAHKKVMPTGEVVEYIENVYPSYSNGLQAIGMVYDRYEPVKGTEQGNTTNNTLILSPDMATLLAKVRGETVPAIEVKAVDKSGGISPLPLLTTKDE